MSVHKKLMQARIKLQGIELKKSGENKFAGYKYFELGDFLPQTMKIFSDLGLASVVSFDKDYARLSITDCDDGTALEITSPMADANLKGAHPIQNLGAVESYQRRYLWLAAMEIVEHDIIDASPGIEVKNDHKPAPKKEVKQEKKQDNWVIEAASGNDFLGDVSGRTLELLEKATSEDDVLQIFKQNKKLFDEVKAKDGEFFKDLMAEFSATKAKFKE